MNANSHDLLVLCRATMQDVLGREVDDEASFFALGGTSLDAVRWMLDIAGRAGVSVNLADVFAAPSPVALSRLLLDRVGCGSTNTAPGARSYPISEQHLVRISARRQSIIDGVVLPNGGPNIFVNGFRLIGALDVAHLAAAVEVVIDRHDLLRAVFHDDVWPYRVSVAPRSYGLEVRDVDVDLAGLRAPFDFGAGQFARFWLVRRGPDVHELWVAIEHIVADGISVDLVLRDLAEVYDQLRRGDRPRLPPMTLSGIALGEHEVELALSPAGWASRDYYAEALAGGVPWQPVTGTHVNPPERVRLDQAVRGGFTMRESQVDHLMARCAAGGNPLLAAVVTALASALYDVAGVAVLTLYCAVSNRGSVLAETVGPIASVVPVRVESHRMSGDADRERVSAEVRRALANSSYPYHRYAREHGARLGHQVSPVALLSVFPQSTAGVFHLDGVDVAELPDTHTARPKPGISFGVVYDTTTLEFSAVCPVGFLPETHFHDLVEHVRRDLCHVEADTRATMELR